MVKPYQIIDEGFVRIAKGFVYQTTANTYATDKINLPCNAKRKEFIMIKGWYFKTYTPTGANDSSMTFWLNTKPDPTTPGMFKGHVMHEWAIQRDLYDNVDKDVAHAWQDESPDTGGYSNYEYFRVRTDIMNPGPSVPMFMWFGDLGIPYANKALWFEMDSGNSSAATRGWVHIYYQLCKTNKPIFYNFISSSWPRLEDEYEP